MLDKEDIAADTATAAWPEALLGSGVPPVLVSCHSACGPRDTNQDVATVLTLRTQAGPPLYAGVIADGMGGYEHGGLAAALAVEAMAASLFNAALDGAESGTALDVWGAALCDAIHAANQRVLAHAQAHPGSNGMGTTLTVALLCEGMLHLGSVGDSRCYLFHDNTLEQLSHDDSFVQVLVDAGWLTPAEAELHPRSHEITRALGWPGDLDGLAITEHPLRPGDLIVLCSDGLWKGSADDIRRGCREFFRRPVTQSRLDRLSQTLVHKALERGADDNTSVALLGLCPGKESIQNTPNNEEK